VEELRNNKENNTKQKAPEKKRKFMFKPMMGDLSRVNLKK
jgi:hypothetical protein